MPGDAGRSPTRLRRKEGAPPLETVRRPELRAVVVLRHRRRARRQYDPWLLRRGEDVNVGRQAVGLVQCADPHELESIAGAGVMRPQCDVARRTANDLLAAS